MAKETLPQIPQPQPHRRATPSLSAPGGELVLGVLIGVTISLVVAIAAAGIVAWTL